MPPPADGELAAVAAPEMQPQTSTVPSSSITPPNVPATAPPAADAARQKRVDNGTKFLSNAAVKASPLNRRVNFLKTKGLSAEEITECFERAGQPQTLAAIKSLISSGTATTTTTASSSAPPAAPVATVTAVASPSPYVPQQQQLYAPQQQLYQQPTSYTHNQPLPASPMPPPLPAGPVPSRNSEKWKDYAIGAAAAGLAIGAAYKVYDLASQFEVRRRCPPSPSPGYFSGATTMNQHQMYALPPASFATQQQSRLRPPPLPAVPLPAEPVTTQPTPEVALSVPPTSSSQVSELEEKVTALETQVSESKTLLDKERREKAEAAVANAKLKAQLTTLSRTNEKNLLEVTKLTTELSALKASVAAAAAVPASAPVSAAAPPAEALQQQQVPESTSTPPPVVTQPETPAPAATSSEPATVADTSLPSAASAEESSVSHS